MKMMWRLEIAVRMFRRMSVSIFFVGFYLNSGFWFKYYFIWRSSKSIKVHQNASSSEFTKIDQYCECPDNPCSILGQYRLAEEMREAAAEKLDAKQAAVNIPRP